MKILLDECLPLDFRQSFDDHETHTVQWAGLKGKKNGELLRMAELAGYEVLLTVDQGIPHQQNLAGRKISIILLRSRTSQIEELLLLVEAILTALDSIQPGQIVAIPLSS
jgi:predicted nuclease of predicted toxin-antitoxin system